MEGWLEFLERIEVVEKDGKYFIKCLPNHPYPTREAAQKVHEGLKTAFFIN